MIDTIEILKKQFEINDLYHQRSNLCFITGKKEQLLSILQALRDLHNYTHLVMVTAVDWIEQNQFQLTYLLHNYESRTDLGIRVFLDRECPVMASIHHLWKQGRVYQQELHEMFGIDFPGSPDQDIPMILEGWQGPPPMRRDFDTKKYSEETYSNRERNHHEPEQYMKQILYPEEN